MLIAVVASAIGMVTPTMAAAATNLISSTYRATLAGSLEGGKAHVFGAEGGTNSTCTTANASATLTSASTAFFLHPTFAGCTAFGFIESSIATTGCDYRYQLGEEIEADTYSAQIDLLCEAGKSVAIIASTCEVQIPTQSLIGSVKVTDNTAASPRKDVSVTSSLEGIDYVKTKDGQSVERMYSMAVLRAV